MKVMVSLIITSTLETVLKSYAKYRQIRNPIKNRKYSINGITKIGKNTEKDA